MCRDEGGRQRLVPAGWRVAEGGGGYLHTENTHRLSTVLMLTCSLSRINELRDYKSLDDA